MADPISEPAPEWPPRGSALAQEGQAPDRFKQYDAILGALGDRPPTAENLGTAAAKVATTDRSMARAISATMHSTFPDEPPYWAGCVHYINARRNPAAYRDAEVGEFEDAARVNSWVNAAQEYERHKRGGR